MTLGWATSSLAYLKHLPVDEVKIDQIFVKNIITDPSDAAIVQAVLDLAQSLQLKVVAEGVENQDVYQQLEHFGCDFIQGYYPVTWQNQCHLTSLLTSILIILI